MNLKQYGWNDFFAEQFSPFSNDGFSAGRVAIEHKSQYILYTEFGELTAEISGKMYFNSESKGDFPAVGDWVVIRPFLDENKAIIEHVLPRQSKFSRKSAGAKTEEQIAASNVDTVFIMSSLNQDINLRRIERYLTLAWDSEVLPVIILSKADVYNVTRNTVSSSPNGVRTYKTLDEVIAEVEGISFNSKIHVISASENTGLEQLSQYFAGNKTIAVLGSSGVGKSTLINSLSGRAKMKVSDIGLYKDKGRHTTTHRELILLPSGGLIIDTPGMRELQMWEGSEGVAETFQDIEKFIGLCRFSDCKHDTEPGCAIKSAIESGEIDEDRYNSYLKLQREVSYFERRQNHKAALAEKKKWKKLSADAKKKGKIKRMG
jgi:ribosome biogenesis GTPase